MESKEMLDLIGMVAEVSELNAKSNDILLEISKKLNDAIKEKLKEA